MSRIVSLVLCLAGLLVQSPVLATDKADARLIGSWVQYTAEGAEVRTITDGPCPLVVIDDRSVTMSERAAPTEQHPDRVCSAPVAPGTRSIRVADEPLPVPLAGGPQRIVVIGDTGCRVSAKHGLYQACNNSGVWPFERVAQSAAASQPDLIVHTGDYIYRESPCPQGNTGCKDTPWGDTPATWEVDWNGPSKPLRAAAPFVFIRGNHETCERAGTGWFRYLDARPYTGTCEWTSKPWLASAGSLDMVVLDTGETKDADGEPLIGLYKEQLAEARDLLSGPGWLVTHQPFWSFGADDDTGEPVTPTGVLQDAVRQSGLPPDVQLLIGAHLHLAEVIGFGDARPVQLVVGNGGTQLVTETPPPEKIDGLLVQDYRVFYQYGYVTMEPAADDGWDTRFRDRNGRVIDKCRLGFHEIVCVKDMNASRVQTLD